MRNTYEHDVSELERQTDEELCLLAGAGSRLNFKNKKMGHLPEKSQRMVLTKVHVLVSIYYLIKLD